MKSALLAAAAVFMAIAGAHAQSPGGGVTYKGLALGATKAEFSAKFPDFACKPDWCDYESRRCAGSLGGTSKEAVDAYRERVRGCADRNSLGGAWVESATAYFRGDQVYKITFSMGSSHVENLIKSARERYGAPSSIDEAPFRTKGGASFPNMAATWEGGGAQLYARVNSGKMGDGFAMLVTLEELRRAAEARKDNVKKGASDF